MKVPFNGQSVHARKILIILSIFLIPSFVNAQFIEVTSNTGDYDIWNDVVTDSQGNIYVVGTYQNSTQIDGQQIDNNILATYEKDHFMVAKYDHNGKPGDSRLALQRVGQQEM